VRGQTRIERSTLSRFVVVLDAVVCTVHEARPDLSLRCRAVVEAVLLSGGSIGPAEEVASHLGLHSRFDLGRLLKREGLPPLHRLAAWASVLTWLERAEVNGCSLCRLAFHARKDPATCYRTVKRITGLPWLEVRRLGSAWVAQRFIAQCRGVQMRPRQGLNIADRKQRRRGMPGGVAQQIDMMTPFMTRR